MKLVLEEMNRDIDNEMDFLENFTIPFEIPRLIFDYRIQPFVQLDPKNYN